MKEIKRVTEICETAYQSTDGQVFGSKEECIKYEESALGVVRGNIAKLIAGKADDAWKLMGGNDDNSVIAIKMNSAADVDLVKQMFLLEHPYYNKDESKELKQKKFDIIDAAYNDGDVVLFGINCEGDYYFINSRQNIIDNLTNLTEKKDA